MRTIHASAVESLTNVGYTELEAKRIRPYLPKHFTLAHPALPRSNVDFWLAYMAVDHFNTVSSRRGRFYSERGVGFWAYNMVSYVCEDFEVEFSEVEFIRHFGEAFYTDYDENVGRRVVAHNPDGSLKVKNRPLQTRMREIQSELNKQNDYQSTFGWHYTSYHVGNLEIPPRGNPNPKALIEMFVHGALAEEYQTDQNGRRMMLGQLDFVMVAKYLYFLELSRMRGMEVLEMNYARRTVLMNMLSRSVSSSMMNVAVSRKIFFVPNRGFFTATGFQQYRNFPNTNQFNYNTSNQLVRFTDGLNVLICTTIPESVFDMYTDEEWVEAVSA